ncbi:MAG TPA: sigma-54 dependent transcriptional regulator, partial [Thermodesulfovibrionales bacterium]|nr:sigma-54 dependent transcriptional regulator [Thermodesulfovibrionales bacterium]
PFTVVNCAAIPRELMESELFGYEKGAFTGAVTRRIGKIEEASSGTLFFDEIGELELSLQAKLLRVLQESEIERLGSNKKIKVNFRLVSSTNRDLKKMVESNTFREDLFYRVNVIQLNLPPLRERFMDIPLLVAEFVKEFCVRERKALTVSDDVMKIFQSYHWPGNVRQLKNVIERAVVLVKGKMITLKELPEEFLSLQDHTESFSKKTLKDLEIQAVKDALRECKGNKSKAAKALGISRKAFYKRLREFQLL